MIAVVHIHKTAGTTLASVFKRGFGGAHCDVHAEDPGSAFLSAADLTRMRRRWYPRLKSVLGHDVRIYSDLESAVEEIKWVTFLRNPVRRTISHYQYDLQRGGVDLPFEEWATHDAVSNRMTRQIAGPDGTADQAIDLMGRFAFVGVTERFDESLVLMQERLGLPDIRYGRKWVAPSDDTKERLLTNPEAVALVESVNQHDLALWDHVMAEVYPKQQAEFGPGLKTATSWFQRRNRSMTVRRMYAHPRYIAYVAKWRLGYWPWVQRKRTKAAH